MSELILYASDDGQTRLHLRVEGESVWLSQLELAELFQTTKQNVSLHAKNIFEDGELSPQATVKESLTVPPQALSECSVRNRTKLAVGQADLPAGLIFRERSPLAVCTRLRGC